MYYKRKYTVTPCQLSIIIIYSTVIVQPRELKHCEVVLNQQYGLWAKMASFREAVSGKSFICCALTILYSTYIYNIIQYGRSVYVYAVATRGPFSLCNGISLIYMCWPAPENVHMH